MSNEMKEAAAVTLWDRLRADHGRIFMWVLVWLFTMSSVVVNGAHALDAMGDGATAWMRAFAVAVAGFFPFAGLVMTEAVLIMIRSLSYAQMLQNTYQSFHSTAPSLEKPCFWLPRFDHFCLASRHIM